MTPCVAPPHGVYILSPPLEQLSWVGGGETPSLRECGGKGVALFVTVFFHFLSIGQGWMGERLIHSPPEPSAPSPSNCRSSPNLPSTEGKESMETPELQAPRERPVTAEVEGLHLPVPVGPHSSREEKTAGTFAPSHSWTRGGQEQDSPLPFPAASLRKCQRHHLCSPLGHGVPHLAFPLQRRELCWELREG